jgi:hypothetical protein
MRTSDPAATSTVSLASEPGCARDVLHAVLAKQAADTAGEAPCDLAAARDDRLQIEADLAAQLKMSVSIDTHASGEGGKLVLHSIGSFDKMNPFTLKGEAPFGMETLVFETLAVNSLDEPNGQYICSQ